MRCDSRAGPLARVALGLAFLPLLHGAACAESAPLTFAVPIQRIAAKEARQGVASDGKHVFAIDNSRIGKYAIATGKRLAEFVGDPKEFPHLNSCTIAAGELVCASSNYPATPHRGTAEIFDPEDLRHLRSVRLQENPGSLTALARHAGHWWAAFAHYDGKGGQAGKDHRDTIIAELDDDFRPMRSWTLPSGVLDRIAPYSISGLSWGAGGALFISGHDKPEIYALTLPDDRQVADHTGTVALASFGQAIDFDPLERDLLWSTDRSTRTIFASRISPPSRQQFQGP